MRRTIALGASALVLSLASCQKTSLDPSKTENDAAQTTPANIPAQEEIGAESVLSKTAATASTTTYTTYLIRKGNNFCDQTGFRSVTVNGAMNFMAKFDQSAIYTTIDPLNQFDINKLWGFSEGFSNSFNSARVGWAYNNGALRLYGYVYAKGVRHSREITTVAIGSDVSCSIRLNGSSYVFTVNGVSVSLPRGTTTTRASGLQQYPYFGGDERAPQDIRIQVRPI
jgi:hypothetical protein